MSNEQSNQEQLDRSLGPLMIWGLGVGYVISGEYFGWNLGLAEGGPYGFMLAMALVTLMYVCFTLSYAELACALPKAGGAFVYGHRAFGREIGFLVGWAQILEFVFAPPAIAFAIGAYLNTYFPTTSPLWFSVGAYGLFTLLNMWGVKHSALFELVITIFAVIELLIFTGVTLPHFSIEHFTQDPLPNGWAGSFAALPFAIWFYLAIEGVANLAEEAKDPQRQISRGFIYAMATLVFLAICVFVSSVGVAGWKAIVYDPQTQQPSDSPLPLAIALVVGNHHLFYHLLVTIGLFGLVASFHGILLVAGRALFEFGRVGYLPRRIGQTHPTRKTPHFALAVNGVIGLIALFLGHTGDMITLAVFGALFLYIVSMLSLLKLRRSEPELNRPYKTPLYPLLPYCALGIALLCMGSMYIFHLKIGLFFTALMGGAWGVYKVILAPKFD